MYYKPSVFSPLVEVTAKATRTLQVSPGFGEFFINVSGAEAALPRTLVGWIILARGSCSHLFPPTPQKAMSTTSLVGRPCSPVAGQPQSVCESSTGVVERQKQSSTSPFLYCAGD